MNNCDGKSALPFRNNAIERRPVGRLSNSGLDLISELGVRFFLTQVGDLDKGEVAGISLTMDRPY